jgi:hypothetical protein
MKYGSTVQVWWSSRKNAKCSSRLHVLLTVFELIITFQNVWSHQSFVCGSSEVKGPNSDGLGESSMGVWQGVAMDSLKFYPGTAMPYPSTPCGQATSKTALWPFQDWPTQRTGGLRPSFIPLDTLFHTPTELSLDQLNVITINFSNHDHIFC